MYTIYKLSFIINDILYNYVNNTTILLTEQYNNHLICLDQNIHTNNILQSLYTNNVINLITCTELQRVNKDIVYITEYYYKQSITNVINRKYKQYTVTFKLPIEYKKYKHITIEKVTENVIIIYKDSVPIGIEYCEANLKAGNYRLYHKAAQLIVER